MFLSHHTSLAYCTYLILLTIYGHDQGPKQKLYGQYITD